MTDVLACLQTQIAAIVRDYPGAEVRLVVETLDNPGWIARLDARDIGFNASDVPVVEGDDTEGWLRVHELNGELVAAGGPYDLARILDAICRALDDFRRKQGVVP
jgi:hypothetical protein